jgi:hypothetical protein
MTEDDKDDRRSLLRMKEDDKDDWKKPLNNR